MVGQRAQCDRMSIGMAPGLLTTSSIGGEPGTQLGSRLRVLRRDDHALLGPAGGWPDRVC